MIRLHHARTNEIWRMASEFLIDTIKKNQDNKILLFLSGGSVVHLYSSLADAIETGEIDAAKLAFAQIDERFQLTTHNYNVNAEVIRETGLWEICEKKGIPYHLVSQEGTLAQSAAAYNETITQLLKEYPYRLAILGIGEDGHTAGLLPGYQNAWDTKKFVVGYENSGLYRQRISVTPCMLKELSHVLVIACGEKKRKAVTNLMKKSTKDTLDRFPALVLRERRGDLFTDR